MDYSRSTIYSEQLNGLDTFCIEKNLLDEGMDTIISDFASESILDEKTKVICSNQAQKGTVFSSAKLSC
jgi:hypothetical protein